MWSEYYNGNPRGAALQQLQGRVPACPHRDAFLAGADIVVVVVDASVEVCSGSVCLCARRMIVTMNVRVVITS